MSQDLYNNLDAPIPAMSWAKEYGLLKAIVSLWDVSLKPTSNDQQSKKLGSGETQHGGAIVAFDDDTNEASLGSGLGGKNSRINTRRPLNPENWVFRPHYAMEANKLEGTWDVRLIAEHENQSDSRDNHGTIVVNQKNKQNWGWLNDIAWLRKVARSGDSSKISDAELKFNDAGFLAQLWGGDAGDDIRYAVSIPVCRNGGFVTDGVYDGQWSQAGRIIEGPADGGGPKPGGPGSTTAGPAPLGGSGTTFTLGGGGIGNHNFGEFGQFFGTNGIGGTPGGSPDVGDPLQTYEQYENLNHPYDPNGIQTYEQYNSYAGSPQQLGGGGVGTTSGVGGNAGAFGTGGVGGQSGGTSTGDASPMNRPGGAAKSAGGQDYSGGEGHATVTSPSNPGQTTTGPGGNPGQTTTAGPSFRAIEWGMRADCAIEFKKDLIGRLVHEPMAASEGQGEPRLVRLFVDKRASPDDHLDSAVDDSSNHASLPKRLLKKAIHGWVRVKDPSPCEPHYDYSYHGPPPNKESKSSGSSGGSVATVDGAAAVPKKTATDKKGTPAKDTATNGGVPKSEGGTNSSTGNGGSSTLTGGTVTETQTSHDSAGNTYTRDITRDSAGAQVGVPSPWVRN